ncbi:MAG: glycosyltransferase family 4 protein [Pyrinomonadaceae bacterium]|nr:glycosyltransferase family 4 protein [Pyrinomonadaceae bacterium]
MTWHIITPEYPPQPGGVSDYTRLVATALAAAGDEVDVWCPSRQGEVADVEAADGVVIHRNFGDFSRSDIRRVDQMLDQFEGPRRLLVQWVPHGFGKRAMNLPFCWWLLSRARRGDRVELMVHEPFLEFTKGFRRQNAVALVHRLMTIILLRAASRVWISIPAWETYWRPYALGLKQTFSWLPVVSNIPVVSDPVAVKAVRSRYVGNEDSLVGHFGAYDRDNTSLLVAAVAPLIGNGRKNVLLLLGRGGERVRDALIQKQPEMADRVHATGALDDVDLSVHLGACDVMLQPYVDGVSSRRGSMMAALAHGLPVVTTSGRLTEPLWAESEAVVVVPVENVAGLVETTRRLLADVEGRGRMGRSAKALYAERFDVRVIISALRDAAATVEGPKEPGF